MESLFLGLPALFEAGGLVANSTAPYLPSWQTVKNAAPLATAALALGSMAHPATRALLSTYGPTALSAAARLGRTSARLTSRTLPYLRKGWGLRRHATIRNAHRALRWSERVQRLGSRVRRLVSPLYSMRYPRSRRFGKGKRSRYYSRDPGRVGRTPFVRYRLRKSRRF